MANSALTFETFSLGAGTTIWGNDDTVETFAVVKELNNYSATTDW
jgi:hypothetical protein